jgi:hypothetical protein
MRRLPFQDWSLSSHLTLITINGDIGEQSNLTAELSRDKTLKLKLEQKCENDVHSFNCVSNAIHSAVHLCIYLFVFLLILSFQKISESVNKISTEVIR